MLRPGGPRAREGVRGGGGGGAVREPRRGARGIHKEGVAGFGAAQGRRGGAARLYLVGEAGRPWVADSGDCAARDLAAVSPDVGRRTGRGGSRCFSGRARLSGPVWVT